ncbi:hypothetical protein Q604_UNBc4C00132G0001, partial [human gut metagenome]
ASGKYRNCLRINCALPLSETNREALKQIGDAVYRAMEWIQISAEAPDLLSRITCDSFYLYSDIATFRHGLGKVCFVHARCHVNALPGLQNIKSSIYLMDYVDLISVA